MFWGTKNCQFSVYSRWISGLCMHWHLPFMKAAPKPLKRRWRCRKQPLAVFAVLLARYV